jgi:hypothetical protein
MTKGVIGVEKNAKRRFAAFISYAHADAAIAAKLQSKLERYRLPKRIAEAHAGGTVALGQIFRDREDLAAAPSLSDAIRAAISEAEALVVICSPDAKASRWVGEEISLFRQLHPGRPILAAIVRSEPDEAFPDALTENGTEPLAADLRAEADGEALGFLKIVAGIAGVPLDALVQRDAQRRLRRVTWITAGALAAMLIMGIMTTLALQARNEAARQRAEAEGLVEYMLTDLRDKLKGVGRPEIINTVNKRAMTYYRDQGALTSLPPDSLERRARVLHAMGEDYDQSNKPDLALASFQEAHKATNELLANDPDNPDRIFAHAQSEFWVGQAAWRKRDRATTTRHWQGYVIQAKRLLDVDEDKARANLEMGYALGNLCDLYLSEKFDLNKAVDNCRKSIAYEQKAAAIKPDDHEIQMALANRYGWLADALLAQKAFEEARKARMAEQQIVDRLLAEDPKNFELRFRQLWPAIGNAMIDVGTGNVVTGASKLTSLAAKLGSLSNEAPDNVEVRRAWLKTLYNRTKALSTTDRAAAMRSLDETKTLLGRLARTPTQLATFSGFLKSVPELEREIKTGGN